MASSCGMLPSGLIRAYKRRDETSRRGMAGVQKEGVQRRDRRRRRGKEIQANDKVRCIKIGLPRLKPRCFLETLLTRRKTGLAEVSTAQQSSRVLARSMDTAQGHSSSSLLSGQSGLRLHQSILRMHLDLSAQGRLYGSVILGYLE